MNREARLLLSQVIIQARNQPKTSSEVLHQRRVPKCPYCSTVGSVMSHSAYTYHERAAGEVVEKTFPSWKECRFCHHEDPI